MEIISCKRLEGCECPNELSRDSGTDYPVSIVCKKLNQLKLTRILLCKLAQLNVVEAQINQKFHIRDK